MKLAMAAIALGAASPLAAQPAETAAIQMPAPDAATIQAAERFVDLTMPHGTMQRIMGGGALGMDAVMDLRVGDFAPVDGATPPADPDLTFAQVMEAQDPHFRERTRITSEVTNRILGEVLAAMEPDLRAAMVDMYARRFTRAELDEMATFFATAAGRKFADLAFTFAQDPAFVRVIRAMMPRMAEAMPRVAREVAAATAHLPPPPRHHSLDIEGDDTSPQED